jgi:nicotinamidase-related amidase
VLLSAERAVLLLVDFQQRLMPAIHDGDFVIARAVRLAEAATLLDVPVLATEQYPSGLGPTVGPLAGYPKSVLAKTSFSAVADPGFTALLPAGTREVIIAGCEAHVCVLQTALDLAGSRHRVILAADATGSRYPADRAAALERARQHGVEVVTSEMVLFEWLRDARHPRFREVQKLLR